MSSEMINKAWEFAGQSEVVNSLAFTNGFVCILPTDSKIYVEHPIYTTFIGALSGALCTLCADVACRFIPKKVKPVLSILLCGSTIYYTYTTIRELKNS